jgi:hypothetical protein
MKDRTSVLAAQLAVLGWSPADIYRLERTLDAYAEGVELKAKPCWSTTQDFFFCVIRTIELKGRLW